MRCGGRQAELDRASMYDLTDTWSGRFWFPRLYPPVDFVARIAQTGARIGGEVEETGRGGADGLPLTAQIDGAVSGAQVAFLKTYNRLVGGYDVVRYEGEIADGGWEVRGTWTIPGNWSGGFLMIRPRGLPYQAERQTEERAPALEGAPARRRE